MTDIPDWYVLERDCVVVHSCHEGNMEHVEELTNVRYSDFISPEKIIFLRGHMAVENSAYSVYMPRG